jgi:hypothetical protein
MTRTSPSRGKSPPDANPNPTTHLLMQSPAPFTAEEAPEVLAVSFFNNLLNRVTVSQLTDDETLPMMGVLRPIMQKFPSLHVAMYKSVMRPGSRDLAIPGLSAEVRPHSQHALSSSFAWTAHVPHIAGALGYLDWVVNHHLRGVFLPVDLWCVPPRVPALSLASPSFHPDTPFVSQPQRPVQPSHSPACIHSIW